VDLVEAVEQILVELAAFDEVEQREVGRRDDADRRPFVAGFRVKALGQDRLGAAPQSAHLGDDECDLVGRRGVQQRFENRAIGVCSGGGERGDWPAAPQTPALNERRQPAAHLVAAGDQDRQFERGRAPYVGLDFWCERPFAS
jgi:hypothetical protein